MKQVVFTAFAILFAHVTYSQCTECVPDMTCIPDVEFPMLCPEVLENGVAGEEYETFLTFYLPAVVEDPESGISADLNEVTVTSIVGLPFGLDYQTNSPNDTYYPSDGDNFGCATLCGIPLLSGDYSVIVNVNVTVTAFGIEQTIAQAFSLPLTIEPGVVGNASFSQDVIAECGSLSVLFEGLINGDPSITTYSWDFGNGEASDEQFPPIQEYTNEGNYEITLETIIQDYYLQSVSLSEIGNGWAGDIDEVSELLFNPDPYFIIIDANDAVVYTSSTIDDQTDGNWDNVNLTLNNPPYQIAFYDEDFFTENDLCGQGFFDLSTGTVPFNVSGSIGFLNISLTTTAQFNDTSEVFVYPVPDPILTLDSPYLTIDSQESDLFIWVLDGDTLNNNNDSLFIDSPGLYNVEVTNEFGCSAWAEEILYCPEITLDFDQESGTLTATPGYQQYEWSFNGLVIEDFNSSILENAEPGNYSVVASTESGCEEESNVVTVTVGIFEFALEQLSLFPNPAINEIQVKGLDSGGSIVQIIDFTGSIVYDSYHNHEENLTLSLDLSSGQYIIRSITKNGVKFARFQKK